MSSAPVPGPSEAPRPDPPDFVSGELLDGVLPAAPAAVRAALVESQLVRLAACEARLDLDLASVLASFSIGEVHLLGHGTREHFARERLGCSWSHVRELLALDKALQSLPRLRSAFLLGAIRRARLRDIVRVATPRTESAWLLAARSLTSAELAARIRAARRPDASAATAASTLSDTSSDDSSRVTIRVDPEQAVFIESVGLPMLRAVVGKEGPRHELMSALAAEILAERGHEPLEHADAHALAHHPTPEGSCKSRRGSSKPPSPRRLLRSLRQQARADARARRLVQRLLARSGGEPDIPWPALADDSIEGRLDHALLLVRWQRALDWQRARLLQLFHERGWCSSRGHSSFGDWLDRRLGLAPREAAVLERAVEAVAALPVLDAAWRSGELSSVQADKVARVASPDTAADWAAFVGEATDKRLDVELAAHAALRVHLGDDGWRSLTRGGRPLRDETMASLRIRWADVFGATVDPGDGDCPCRVHGPRATPASDSVEGSCNSSTSAPRTTPLASGTAPSSPRSPSRRGPVPASFAFDAPADAAEEFRLAVGRVRAESGGALDSAGALIEMFWRFAAVHVTPGLQDEDLRARILRRDGWQCAMPHCRNRRNLEVHHIRYRSRGGGHQRWNLVTACASCHRLEHLGLIQVASEGMTRSRGDIAPALVVRIGQDVHPRSAILRYREGLRLPGISLAARTLLASGW